MLNKEVSSTIFKVFGMTQPGIEHRSPGPLANSLPHEPIRKRDHVHCVGGMLEGDVGGMLERDVSSCNV